MLTPAALVMAALCARAAAHPEHPEFAKVDNLGLTPPGGYAAAKKSPDETLEGVLARCAAASDCKGVAVKEEGEFCYFIAGARAAKGLTKAVGWTTYIKAEYLRVSAEGTEKEGEAPEEDSDTCQAEPKPTDGGADEEAQECSRSPPADGQATHSDSDVRDALRRISEDLEQQAAHAKDAARRQPEDTRAGAGAGGAGDGADTLDGSGASADKAKGAEASRPVPDEGDDDDEEEEEEEDAFADVSPPTPESEELYQSGKVALFAPADEHERNITHAVLCFNQSASAGHAGAQFYLGFMYSAGLGVRPSEMMAVLYYTFAAMSGNADAALALSYRYHYGYGVPKSCADAQKHYRALADLVAKAYTKQAVSHTISKFRLSDPVALRTKQREEDLIQYYQYNADRGDTHLQMVLGYAHMWGIKGMQQDPQQAKHYFELAAERGNPAAYGGLGTMYAQGVKSASNPVQRNYTAALEYFEEGAKEKHAVSLNGLGYLYMKGAGVVRNYTKAVAYFSEAVKSKNPEALYNLGVMWLEGRGVKRADKNTALSHLSMAAELGQVLAHWKLGTLEEKSCEASVGHLKTVCGQGKWGERLEEAHRDYLDGDYTTSLLKYMIASEQGHEVAHVNAAYLLDNNLGMEDINASFTMNPAYTAKASPNVTADADYNRHALALKYYKKATEQDSTDAIVKVGDYNYYGMGVDVDVDKALSSYKLGAARRNHQAMFNLGYMHEHGVSIAQDFHLAKRYYDQAFEASDHAYWPITLALIKLQVHWWVVDTFCGTTSPSPNLPPKDITPSARGKGKGKEQNEYFKLWGHRVEDVVLGTLLVLLFLTLFIRHTARQVAAPVEGAAEAAPPVAPAAPVPAEQGPPAEAATDTPPAEAAGSSSSSSSAAPAAEPSQDAPVGEQAASSSAADGRAASPASGSSEAENSS
eukprot:TRINITY_DN422_c1_g4_i1.p1 TRINITY_DN422_c1_g4~~TRINITY_DN422_c1_g4_i1.p1  ORF type:complete len:927 (+),score=320.67 TRINITY_DN422_c1_g4_i1:64-2844(+)